MTLPFSLPDFHVTESRIVDDRVLIIAISQRTMAACPACQQESSRIHSWYIRSPHDLPVCGERVQLQLHVRRFRCLNPACQKATFAERLPKVVAFASRKTVRLRTLADVFALLVGGELGSHLFSHLGIQMSPDTLLRQIHRTNSPMVPTPKILGVDDFAFRKGNRYGTLLIDWERHQPIDLLPDRTASTLATWLRAHPGVQWISRDRSGEYARGATEGAPLARQVVDRWHLQKNWREMLERAFHRVYSQLQRHVVPDTAAPYPRLPRERSSNERQSQQDARARRKTRYDEVNALFQQQLPIARIASQLHLTRTTVYKYVAAETFPERAPRAPSGSGRSILSPYKSYLRRRTEQGCLNGQHLYREICDQGYVGSYKTVLRWLQSQGLLPRRQGEQQPETLNGTMEHQGTTIPDENQTPHILLSEPLRSARSLSWLLMNDPAELDAADHQMLTCIRQEPAVETMYRLTQHVRQLLKERQADQLEAWLGICADCGIPEIEAFALGIRRDFSAVQAAFQFPYSNGPTEGLVNRLKLIKRSMYGRGSFELLRQRVLRYATCYG
ncbi:ISL3 family transposase [Dictyobacter formicarum]|nr:ISL3 family transposase [Dictyobacter formicarum]